MTEKKIRKIVKAVQKQQFKLRPDDIEYIIELANKHPKWSVDRIFEEATRPKIRNCLLLPLTPTLKEALEKAAKVYQISLLAVAHYALKEWLKDRKFLKN